MRCFEIPTEYIHFNWLHHLVNNQKGDEAKLMWLHSLQIQNIPQIIGLNIFKDKSLKEVIKIKVLALKNNGNLRRVTSESIDKGFTQSKSVKANIILLLLPIISPVRVRKNSK